MNVFSLTIQGQTEDKTLNYTVSVLGYDNLWKTIFYGKVFVVAGQTRINIELQDVLWNHKYTGEYYIAPVLNTAGDNYVMSGVMQQPTSYWYNSVKVEIPSLNVSVSKNVTFFANTIPFTTKGIVAPQTAAIEMSYQPVAHIPNTYPQGFEYRQLVWNGSFTRKVDNTSTVYQFNKLGIISFNGANESYSLNGEVIAKIDKCPKPYYLVWMTNEGGMQCQGFLKASDVSVDYNNNERVDMSNWKWNYNKTVEGSINLKSGLLSDRDYKAYGQLFASPYLILLDIENNRLYYVNVKDTTYKQKINKQGQRIYFEVNVGLAEVQTI